MLDLLLVNIRTLFRFYARNRLLLAFGVLILVIFGLSLLPAILFSSTTSRFDLLRQVASEMNGFAFVFIPALGLIAVSSHRHGRNVKMVVTKPCPPEIWVASIFVSAALVAFVIHALAAAGTGALSLVWGVPYQAGFLVLALVGFFESLVALSLLIALAMAVHPVVAVMTIVFFNEGTFAALRSLAAAAHASTPSPWLLAAQVACDSFYTALPLFDLLGEKGATIRSSLRVAGGDWLVLLGAGSYALLAAVFFFVISAWLLRRQSLA